MTQTFAIKVENDTVFLRLLPILDMAAAAGLLTSLQSCAAEHSNITLDSEEVERVSTPCVQVILAASFKIIKAGGSFSIMNMSPGFERGMRDLGLSEYIDIWSKN